MFLFTIHAIWLPEKCESLPFELLQEFAGVARPESGDVWRANLYRCGSTVDEVHASWQKVPKKGLGFHQPRFFAPLIFE